MKKILMLNLVALSATLLHIGAAEAFASSSSEATVKQHAGQKQAFDVGTGAQGPVYSAITAQQLQNMIADATSSAGATATFSPELSIPMVPGAGGSTPSTSINPLKEFGSAPLAPINPLKEFGAAPAIPKK